MVGLKRWLMQLGTLDPNSSGELLADLRRLASDPQHRAHSRSDLPHAKTGFLLVVREDDLPVHAVGLDQLAEEPKVDLLEV